MVLETIWPLPHFFSILRLCWLYISMHFHCTCRLYSKTEIYVFLVALRQCLADFHSCMYMFTFMALPLLRRHLRSKLFSTYHSKAPTLCHIVTSQINIKHLAHLENKRRPLRHWRRSRYRRRCRPITIGRIGSYYNLLNNLRLRILEVIEENVLIHEMVHRKGCSNQE